MGTLLASTLEDVRQEILQSLPQGSVLTLTERAGTVSLDLLFIQHAYTGNGAATQALRLLCTHADLHQWTLCLVPVDSFGADLHRLRGWYRRWGFQGTETMVRYPR